MSKEFFRATKTIWTPTGWVPEFNESGRKIAGEMLEELTQRAISPFEPCVAFRISGRQRANRISMSDGGCDTEQGVQEAAASWGLGSIVMPSCRGSGEEDPPDQY